MPHELALDYEQEQKQEQGRIAEESREEEPIPERDPDDFLEF